MTWWFLNSASHGRYPFLGSKVICNAELIIEKSAYFNDTQRTGGRRGEGAM